MRRKALLPLFLILSFAACGQETFFGDTATLEWDVVSQYADATPFLATDIVEYEVYRSVHPVADRGLPDVSLGTVSIAEALVVFPDDGNSRAYAVRAKITTDEGNTELLSGFNWSDVKEPGETTQPFLCKRRTNKTPAMPLSLYLEGL